MSFIKENYIVLFEEEHNFKEAYANPYNPTVTSYASKEIISTRMKVCSTLQEAIDISEANQGQILKTITLKISESSESSK